MDIPELAWLAETCDADDSWPGPGPRLPNLQSWLRRIAENDLHEFVSIVAIAAQAALANWDAWFAESPEYAMESIAESQSPSLQLAAVARWLDSPTNENLASALNTVDHTKQLHWFHDDYSDVWFDEPAMWAAESSEYCVLTLTGDPYSNCSRGELAVICVSSAINSFRRTADDEIRTPLAIIVDAFRRHAENNG